MKLPAVAHLGQGQVRHARLRPSVHAFAYGTYFLLLPMRQITRPEALGGLAVNRAGFISFHDEDHGDGRGPEQGGALAWVEELLAREGIHDATGEIWLHTYPRVLGYTFKPVSFWYCHSADGALRAVVTEVNNTFSERHCYLLDRPRFGVDQVAEKTFHVSPFCEVRGQYRFRFMTTDQSPARTVVRIDYQDEQGPLLRTSVQGQLAPMTRRLLRQAFWRHPAMTLMVMVRIHWQALKLWLKRTGFHRKPLPPAQRVTRADWSPHP